MYNIDRWTEKAENDSKDQSTSFINHDASFTPILRQLILNAEKNVESVPNHRQHPEILKKFVMAKKKKAKMKKAKA